MRPPLYGFSGFYHNMTVIKSNKLLQGQFECVETILSLRNR